MPELEYIQKLYTAKGKNPDKTPWNVYPRPLLKREKWLCLNGKWTLFYDKDFSAEVTVPFPLESLLSEFNQKVSYGKEYIYHIFFSLPESWKGMRILIHFGGVSRKCDLYLNEFHVGSNNNAYIPFSFDITGFLKDGENSLRMVVSNDLSTEYPYGKQKINRGGMWYTPVTGIWQTVWLEPVPQDGFIEEISIKTDMTGADIYFKGISSGEIICDEKTYHINEGHARIEPENPVLWSPENPYLYDFRIKAGQDEATSYLALRKVSVETVKGKKRICLNGRPYFFHGLLDQGYYSDGIYTPASPEMYTEDITNMKKLGFNTLRKHIKTEPEYFYYECDRLGMIVFQDMVNNGKYRFSRDTLLPTVGIKTIKDTNIKSTGETKDIFISTMKSTVHRLSSHPCICYWTIFNEGWGQFDSDKLYDILKSEDDTRITDSTSGWFHQKKSDVCSLHIYFKKLKLDDKSDLPQIISEFGGYVYKVEGHSFNTKKTYGYKIIKTREQFVQDLRRLYLEEVVPLAEKGLCGAIYTQVSDVEDETNGLVTYDRAVCKISPEEFKDIAGKLKEAVDL